MAPAKTPLLDLFSGIGGFSRALQDVCRTVAYCEVDADCRDVLRARMADGALDAAPIFEDVTTLTGEDVRRTMEPGAVALLTAGFPCHDISCGGASTGLHGARSRLFFQIPRLLDELGDRVGGVLLENSPCIRKLGAGEVIAALEARGFRCRWGVFSPGELGCPQRRWRWVLLGLRDGFTLRAPAPEGDGATWPAEGDPAGRLTWCAGAEAQAEMERRAGMLGNCVVPRVIAHAVRCLLLAPTVAPIHQTTSDASRCRFPALTYRIMDPRDSSVVVYERPFWATPVRHPLYWRVLALSLGAGRRSTRNLWNQLAYEAGTAPAMRRVHGDAWRPGRSWRPNPEWIEWLMGYPRGYTLSASAT